MDAVNGADIDTGGIFCADARIGNDKRHSVELTPKYGV
jgi:hypothetical protein